MSKKGIPHGILHFPEQIQLAGHIYMHDVTASEGGHRLFVKKAMNRVRKGTDYDTSSSSIDWVFRVRTWAKIIDDVDGPGPPTRRRKAVQSLTVFVNRSKMLTPTEYFTTSGQHSFSPLQTGGDNLLCNDVRISYHELSELVRSYTGWDEHFVKNTAQVTSYPSHVNITCVHHMCTSHVHITYVHHMCTSHVYITCVHHLLSPFLCTQVKLYCSAERCDPGKERRTYWATENRYPYNGGSRRDMVHVVWDPGNGRPKKIGCAQITSFIQIDGGVDRGVSEGVIIRWMDKSSLCTNSDHPDLPVCDYPLSFNHCLWEWCKTPRPRKSFRSRGFMNRVRRDGLWNHIDEEHREGVIRSESRSRYDIVSYKSIMSHVNVHRDPSTGHMLQTLQIL